MKCAVNFKKDAWMIWTESWDAAHVGLVSATSPGLVWRTAVFALYRYLSTFPTRASDAVRTMALSFLYVKQESVLDELLRSIRLLELFVALVVLSRVSVWDSAWERRTFEEIILKINIMWEIFFCKFCRM